MFRAVCASALLLPLLGCAETLPRGLEVLRPPVIELPDGAVEILPGLGTVDSPALSPDGNRLAVQLEVYRDPVLPYEIYSAVVAEKDAAGLWGNPEVIRRGVYRKWLGRMTMPIQPSFDPGGERLLLTQLEFDSFLSIPFAPSLRSRVERIPWRGGDAERIVSRQDWGLPPTELLQHARVSPDGRRLAFYTRVHKEHQGVYLLDLQNGRHFRLSSEHDKHPTWSPDGRRIYFHTVTAGRRHRFDVLGHGLERAVIGFFDLQFDSGGELTQWTRRLMDPPDHCFRYHKHPTEVAGAGLLFFHGALEPGGKKKLMVRGIEPGSRVYVVEPRRRGKRLKAAKHPCSSSGHPDLVFIAKPKGGDRFNLLMALTDEALDKIRKVVHGE